jgi:hypothetical protein
LRRPRLAEIAFIARVSCPEGIQRVRRGIFLAIGNQPLASKEASYNSSTA